jgi:ATP-binding cassette subfamily B protein
MAAGGQLDQVVNWLGLVASAAVLAWFAWWLVPLFWIPAAIGALVRNRQQRGFTKLWRAGLVDMARADSWQDAVLSPGAGKDLRIFGAGDWAVDRIRFHQAGPARPGR